jgi:hypothetical protein
MDLLNKVHSFLNVLMLLQIAFLSYSFIQVDDLKLLENQLFEIS